MSDHEHRLTCIVPFCRCTAPQKRHPQANEFICEKHWNPLPLRLRRLYSAVKRRLRRSPMDDHRRAQAERVWGMCKRLACGRAGGIA